MAAITAAMVKELRERTQAGMLDCKKALAESDGDMEKAVAYLREKGLAAAAKKAGRVAAEGAVESYIHMGGKIGVLLKVENDNAETLNNETFKTFYHDVALQIAAAKPSYVCKEEVPSENLAKEREIL
ncbi:MAG: translation elongation factor Ts, partial [Clostridia bacterium]|nr:translation elongation factor Ts [Clostridia bacterium]